MQQPIVGFHQDDVGDWVADLACGHTQHVRHQPPWVNRPWVITVAGRCRHLGRRLWCKRCEQTVTLRQGQLLTLHAGMPHDVEAVEESAFL